MLKTFYLDMPFCLPSSKYKQKYKLIEKCTVKSCVWEVCVCVCVCVFVCFVYVCMCVYVFVCIAFIYICVCVCVCVLKLMEILMFHKMR